MGPDMPMQKNVQLQERLNDPTIDPVPPPTRVKNIRATHSSPRTAPDVAIDQQIYREGLSSPTEQPLLPLAPIQSPFQQSLRG